MKSIYLFAVPVVLALTSCTTAQVAQVDKYQQDVQTACSLAASSAADPAAVLLAANVPDVAKAVSLVAASCGTEKAVAALVLSPTSVAWLGTLVTTIKSGGKTVPPAPVAPS